MMDHKLLKQARENLKKEAFNPMTPEAQAAAAQQGAAPPPPGAAPMPDPAMAGGMPPEMMAPAGGMPPEMAGMPPEMMADPMAGGIDPMTGMPIDPAAAGAAPPMEDPMAAGTPVTLNLEDLQTVLKELGAGGDSAPEGEEGESKRATNRQIMDELAGLREMVSALAAAAGIQLPAGEVGEGAGTELDAMSANPEDIAAVAEGMAGGDVMAEDPMSQAMAMGLPPGEMPPGAMPKMAIDKWSNTQAAKRAEKTN